MTATARHLIPLMVLAGMLAISLTFLRLMLGLISWPFGRRRPPPRSRPEGPVIEGTYVDLTQPPPAERPPEPAPTAPPGPR